jgi:hypothetical protein
MRAIPAQAMDKQKLKWSRPGDVKGQLHAITREFHGLSPNHYPVEQYLANLHRMSCRLRARSGAARLPKVGLPSFREPTFQPPNGRIRMYGTTAVNTGYYTFSYVKDGETKTFPARYSLTFVKNGERWLIVDHHSSAMPPPPK